MTRLFQNLIYILLQIILLPFGLIGMIYANYKQQKNSKKENNNTKKAENSINPSLR